MDTNSHLRAEIERIRGVADLMTTAHSVLRDRLRRTATGSDLCMLMGSGWVAALGLADAKFVAVLNPLPVEVSVLTGLLGLLVFALGLIALKMNWSERSVLHDRAADTYGRLKLEILAAIAQDAPEASERFKAIIARYTEIGHQSAKISDRQFLTLKALHKRKQALSRLVSERPGTPLWALRLRIWWHGAHP